MNNPRIPGRPGLSRGAPQPPPGRAGRPYRPTPAANNPLPLILGIGGGVLALVLIFVVMSSGDKEPAPVETAPPPEAAPPPPKPVDVSGLEREGEKACEEGLALFKSLEPKISGRAKLTAEERHQLKLDVKKSMDLMFKGMGFLSEAKDKSGHSYDVTRFGSAHKLAASIYHELD